VAQVGTAATGVAVNVSAIQFTRGDLEASVRTGAGGIRPATRDCLELELTESILIQIPTRS
jgi:EAL domain-containing protein (putative c-di-GMP-specific phosphodiesterase class I)